MTREDAHREIVTLVDFLRAIDFLLSDIESCSPVLFRARFRDLAREPLAEARYFIRERGVKLVEEISPRERELAGLGAGQLRMKLTSYHHSQIAYYETGDDEHLEECMDKGSTILQSIAGAIPGFGSLLQELIEFLLKELSARWRKKLRRIRAW